MVKQFVRRNLAQENRVYRVAKGNMESLELAKVLASGGAFVILIYVSITLWNALKEQISQRVKFLEERVKALESESDEGNQTKTGA